MRRNNNPGLNLIWGVTVLCVMGANYASGAGAESNADKKKEDIAPACVTLKTRDLEVVVARNGCKIDGHGASYHGIARLVHKDQGKNVVSDPSDGGLAKLSLLNWEFSRIRGIKDEKWADLAEPRGLPMTVEKLSENSVRLHEPPGERKGVEWEMVYTVRDPYYIDFEITYTFHKRDVPPPLDFQGAYASYLHGPYIEDVNFYFIGRPLNYQINQWMKSHTIKFKVPLGTEKKEFKFVAWKAARAEDRLDHDYKIDEVYGISYPFHYSLVGDFTYILMFKRDESEQRAPYSFSCPNIRLSDDISLDFIPPTAVKMLPSGEIVDMTTDGYMPWDFCIRIPRAEWNKKYTIKGRLIYKKFVSRKDVIDEYKKWSGEKVEIFPKD